MGKLIRFLVVLVTFLFSVFLTLRQSHAPRSGPVMEAEHASGAMEALNFWTRARAYPQPDIPSDAYYRAYTYSKSRFRDLGRARSQSDSWEAIGPHNIGGRTIAVALNPLNPNTIYAGSAGGGLWRSRTAGKGALAWEQIPTGYAAHGVMAIGIDPLDSMTIYIGTGEVYGYQSSIGGTVIRTTRGSYGVGLLKTTDGGSTWAASIDWTLNQERGVEAIRINPLNHNSLYAATSEGVYKTMNAGASWTLSLDALMGEDILFHPTDTNRVLVSCGNFGSDGTGVYKTTDGGGSWNAVLGGYTGKSLLSGTPADPELVYASVANAEASIGIYKSTNFGSSWSLVNTQDIASYQGFYSHYVSADPSNANIVYSGGGPDFWKSTNGGTTFVQKAYWYTWYLGLTLPGEPEGPPYYAHADHHAFTFHPSDPGTMYLATDGGIFCSTDGGESFEGRNGGYQTTQFYNGFSSSATDSNLSMGGMQDNASALYQGTVAWYRVIGGDGCWSAIDPTNDSIIYGEYQYNNILKSTDRGINFDGAGFSGNGAAFSSPYVLAPSQPEVLYSGRSRMYKTTDGAANWIETNGGAVLDNNSVLSLAVSHSSPDTAYAGTAPTLTIAHIFRTTNGGTSWTNITGLLPNRYPMDIAVDPADSRRVFAAFGGYGSGHLFRSNDAGGSWTDVTGALPDVPTSAVIVDPISPEMVYAGNDIGVYVSSDGGSNWWSFSEGLPEAVIVTDLSISPSNRKLRVATHGNGAYQRRLINIQAIALSVPNGGESWDIGSIHAVTWSQRFVSAVRLDYSTDDGSTWATIAGTVPASPASFDWTVPEPPSTAARIRVVSLDDTTLRDESDNSFSAVRGPTLVSIGDRWNMISLPVQREDRSASDVYQTASTPAYGFDLLYAEQDSLDYGIGYWMKFSGQQVVPVYGEPILESKIDVGPGWHLLGSLARNIPVAAITTDPPDNFASKFFGYSNGYFAADTLDAGKAVWIKTKVSGTVSLPPP